MLRVPKKNSVCWVKISDLFDGEAKFEGVSVAIRYIGPRLAERWSLDIAKVRLEDLKRLGALRKGNTQAEIPEFWDANQGVVTDEGFRATMELARGVVNECVVGIRGVLIDGEPDDVDDDIEERAACADADTVARARELVEYMGLTEKVAMKAIALQNLEQAENFC